VPVLKVIIRARAPLVFSERRPGGQFRPSELYVPGSVVRGALAQRLLDAGVEDGEDFRTLFHGDAPLFRNAYPAAFHLAGEGVTLLPSRPLPATAYACKTRGGFEDEPSEYAGGSHGVFDGLVDRLCCETLGMVVPYVPRCNHPDHGGKGERVETRSGFYTLTPQGKPREVRVGLRLTTRVAVNRRRKVAEDGMLYSPLVISETTKVKHANGEVQFDTSFQGSIVADGACREVVERHLRQLTHIGSGASRGFGLVDVEAEVAHEDDPVSRVRKFNDLVARRWALWERVGAVSGSAPAHSPTRGTFFAVMLVSDAVLLEEGWSPTVRLVPEMLGKAGRNAKLLRCYTSADYRGGWNTAWRLPKDTELTARMGSVYVYHTTDGLDEAEWCDSLRALEESGVGERRREGFGQVRVCDEFHGEIQEK
jgi:CRISPR-associated protein Csx10